MADKISPPTLKRLDSIRNEIGAGPRQLTGIVKLEADPPRVFAIVTEIAGMTMWMHEMQGGAYEDRGPSDPIRAGMIRRLSFGPVDDLEKVISIEQYTIFAYSIIGGMPIKGHLAVMEIEAGNTGSHLIWHQCFNASVLMAPLRRRMVRGFVTRSLTKLSAELGGHEPRLC